MYGDVLGPASWSTESFQRVGRVAQLAEQCPFKAWVAGSNPAALTKVCFEGFVLNTIPLFCGFALSAKKPPLLPAAAMCDILPA